MVTFRLTEGRHFGEDQDCDISIFPGFAGHEARPKGGLSCFWSQVLLQFRPATLGRSLILSYHSPGGNRD